MKDFGVTRVNRPGDVESAVRVETPTSRAVDVRPRTADEQEREEYGRRTAREMMKQCHDLNPDQLDQSSEYKLERGQTCPVLPQIRGTPLFPASTADQLHDRHLALEGELLVIECVVQDFLQLRQRSVAGLINQIANVVLVRARQAPVEVAV